MPLPTAPAARASAAVRHAEVVAAIAARHLLLMERVFATYRSAKAIAFTRANQLAINEGWKSLGTIQALHREFDEALR